MGYFCASTQASDCTTRARIGVPQNRTSVLPFDAALNSQSFWRIGNGLGSSLNHFAVNEGTPSPSAPSVFFETLFHTLASAAGGEVASSAWGTEGGGVVALMSEGGGLETGGTTCANDRIS